jgi:hypothetical protein
MLGMGPMLWRLANLKMHGDEKWARDEPVGRDEAWLIADPFCDMPKYRYEYPAAWLYYGMLDVINRRTSNGGGE